MPRPNTNTPEGPTAPGPTLQAMMAVVRSAPGPLSLVDLESGEIVEMSDTMATMGATTRDAVVGRASTELGWIHPSERAALVEELRTLGFTRLRRIDDGQVGGPGGRTVGFSARLVTVEGRPYLLGTCEDLTRQTEAEARLLKRLETLYELAQATLAGRNPRDIAQAAVGKIRELLRCDRCSVIAFDRAHEEMHMLATSFEGSSDLGARASFPMTDLRAFRTILNGDAIMIDDLAAVPDLPEAQRILVHEGIRTYYGFPVAPAGTVTAALAIGDARPAAFDDETIAVAREMAAQLALAMERALLQEQTERDAAELAHLIEQLRETDADRRHLLAQVVHAQEEERRHIANDIHDDSIQKMAAVGLRLDVLRHLIDDPGVEEQIDQLAEVVSLSIGRLRRLMFELWPADLERYGLAAAIRTDLIVMRDDYGIEFDLQDDLGDELPLQERIIAYRIVQEALSNVRRHAEASRIEVRLWDDSGTMCASVSDDGKGLPDTVRSSPPGHWGLSSMRERAELAGGWMTLGTSPNGGAEVLFCIPMSHPDERIEEKP